MSTTVRVAKTWAHLKMRAKAAYSVLRSEGFVGLWLRLKEQTIDVAAIVLIGQGVSTACDGFVGEIDPAPLLVGILLVAAGLTLFALKKHAANTEKEFKNILKKAVERDDKKTEELKDDSVYYEQARAVLLKDKESLFGLRLGLLVSAITLAGVLILNATWPEEADALDEQAAMLASTVSNLEHLVSALARADKALADEVRSSNGQVSDSMARMVAAVSALQAVQSNTVARLDDLYLMPKGEDKPAGEK